MTADVDALRDTLIWAAGGPREHTFDLDVDTLLDAVTEHRMEGRVLRQIRRHQVSAPPRLTRELYDRYHTNVVRVAEQIRLFARVRSAVRTADPSHDVLPVKGFSLFALSGDMYHVQPSNKLDLVASDPAGTVHAVSAADDAKFAILGDDHRFTYAASARVLVHVGFPVTTFPATAPADAFDPRRHPGTLRVPQLFGSTLLTFEDISAHSAEPAIALDGPVSSPEMVALIRCAHSYLGYTMYPLPLPHATIFLNELCQIGDLLALDGFDTQRFARLVERHQVGLSVAFVRQMWVELLGADPFHRAGLPSAVPPSAELWFPQDLWWDGVNGLPTRLGWTARELVAGPDDGRELVDVLGPGQVTVRRDEPATLVLDPDGPGAPRMIAYATDPAPGSAILTLTDTGQTFAATVSLPDLGPEVFLALGLEGSRGRYELFYWPAERRTALTAYAGQTPRPDLPALADIRTDHADGRHLLTIEAPSDVLWPSADRDIRLLVRARQQRAPWGEVLQSVLVPLVACRLD